ncbi:TPA: hypothetical protein L5P32_000888 [Pseudomonas aeruginosa]|nr:hypothetical protein CKA45_01970 [Pseudomonas aeruginosa]RLR89203.1 hypothetical protein CKA49_03485 [Pseudomonas aeruginosa]RMK27610.1 hypothetical protein IPC1256_06920 [Pseudomonas aeruginosa]RPY19169.1 hypothetical protein IPC696_09235 [Pseudomonas aeruginosa]RUC12069.1 hypothetical protein IPC1412_12045 [Pseudomonas aeruginosa]
MVVMRFAKVFLSFGVIVLCVLLIGGTSEAIRKHVTQSIYDSSPEVRAAISRASTLLKSSAAAEQKQVIDEFRPYREKSDQAYRLIFWGQIGAYLALMLASTFLYLRLNPRAPKEPVSD